MGSGKTTAAINYINNSNVNSRFLYITPFLSEVRRVKSVCVSHNFVEPTILGGKNETKAKAIRKLISEGKNIASTHALFDRLTDFDFRKIKEENYTLIIDEAPDVATSIPLSGGDAEIIRSLVNIGNDGKVVWKDALYSGIFSDYKRFSLAGSLYLFGNNTMLKLLPTNSFSAFKDVFLLTYLFNAQPIRLYFDFLGLKYQPIFISSNGGEDYRFSEKNDMQPTDYREYITICKDCKLNGIGRGKWTLSKNWYDNINNDANIERLRKSINTYFRSQIKAKASQILWTTYSDFRDVLSDKGYKNSFISCNSKASNDYRDRTVLAYPINRFFNPHLRRFFTGQGMEVDEDGFALSEMLQWIWRSAIRERGKINIYVPSQRMRRLLEGWLSVPH